MPKFGPRAAKEEEEAPLFGPRAQGASNIQKQKERQEEAKADQAQEKKDIGSTIAATTGVAGLGLSFLFPFLGPIVSGVGSLVGSAIAEEEDPMEYLKGAGEIGKGIAGGVASMPIEKTGAEWMKEEVPLPGIPDIDIGSDSSFGDLSVPDVDLDGGVD